MSTPIRVRVRRPAGDEPRRNGSGRTDPPVRNNSSTRVDSVRSGEPPVRGIGRNKSLPTGARRPTLEGIDDATKQRRPVRRPTPSESGDPVRKGRKAPSARGINASRSMGADQLRPRGPTSESNLAPAPAAAKRGRKGGSGSSSSNAANRARSTSRPRPDENRARSTSRPRPDAPRPRSRSADPSAHVLKPEKPRSAAANLGGGGSGVGSASSGPIRKGRRAPEKRVISSNKSDMANNPALASPSSRKTRRAPERRGIAPSKSLPSEQIRRVEQSRRGTGDRAARSHSDLPDDSSSEESSEPSSSSESSVEPSTSYDEEKDSDIESDDGSFTGVLHESQPYVGNHDTLDSSYAQSSYAHSGFGSSNFDDDVTFGPPPQIGGRVVYPGGIVVEDASGSEAEFEHWHPSRNLVPDLEAGEQSIEPVTHGKRVKRVKKVKPTKADDAKRSSSSAARAKKERSGSSVGRSPTRASADRNRDKERRRAAKPSAEQSRRSAGSAQKDRNPRPAPRKQGPRNGSSSNERMFGGDGSSDKPTMRSGSAERLGRGGSSHSRQAGRPGVKRTNSAEKLFNALRDKVKGGSSRGRSRSSDDDDDLGIRVTPSKGSIKMATPVQATPVRRTGTGESRSKGAY
eukprot:scaffold6898_cov123-Cylindrotheca_fusiformis.AAC.10